MSADVLTSAPPASAKGLVVRLAGGNVVVGEVTNSPGPGQTTTAVQTSVAANAASVTLLASNANRVNATIYNDPAGTAGGNLFVSFVGAASQTNFITKLPPGFQLDTVSYGWVGLINGIWDVANGSARITEMTP